MIFEITKPIIATLRVECNSKEEALNWVGKIVATIENENGNPISSNQIEYFEAETAIAEVEIVETSTI